MSFLKSIYLKGVTELFHRKNVTFFVALFTLMIVISSNANADSLSEMESTLQSAVKTTTSPLKSAITAFIALGLPIALFGVPVGAFFYGKKHAEQKQSNGNIMGAIWAVVALVIVFVLEVLIAAAGPKVGLDVLQIMSDYWSGSGGGN